MIWLQFHRNDLFEQTLYLFILLDLNAIFNGCNIFANEIEMAFTIVG